MNDLLSFLATTWIYPMLILGVITLTAIVMYLATHLGRAYERISDLEDELERGADERIGIGNVE